MLEEKKSVYMYRVQLISQKPHYYYYYYFSYKFLSLAPSGDFPHRLKRFGGTMHTAIGYHVQTYIYVEDCYFVLSAS